LLVFYHGRPQGRARGAIKSMFIDFLGENSIYFVVLRQKVGKFLPSPGKKSTDAHVFYVYVKEMYHIERMQKRKRQ
jgi:hypothetical protein